MGPVLEGKKAWLLLPFVKKGGEGDGKLKWNLVAGFYVFGGFVYVYFFLMVVVDLFCYSCI